MDLHSLLPIVAAVLVGLVIFRVVVAALRMSAKLMMWGVLAAAVFGLGYVWYQNQDPSTLREIPALNIPGNERPAP